jgi:protein gp37
MKDTAIEWADDTFNGWWGCTEVGPGCDHCYARELSRRYGKDVWGPGKERSRNSAKYWEDEPKKFERAAISIGRRRRVFFNSMSDVFDAEVSQQWRIDLFNRILRTSYLDWLLLTKRIGRAVKDSDFIKLCRDDARCAPIWLGTSVEDQIRFNLRINNLSQSPADLAFLSAEPLLGPIDIRGHEEAIDWVIVGGESGPDPRPMNIEWARQLKDQCKAAGVAFFMKQLGGYPDKRKSLDQFPDDLRIREFPANN